MVRVYSQEKSVSFPRNLLDFANWCERLKKKLFELKV